MENVGYDGSVVELLDRGNADAWTAFVTYSLLEVNPEVDWGWLKVSISLGYETHKTCAVGGRHVDITNMTIRGVFLRKNLKLLKKFWPK